MGYTCDVIAAVLSPPSDFDLEAEIATLPPCSLDQVGRRRPSRKRSDSESGRKLPSPASAQGGPSSPGQSKCLSACLFCLIQLLYKGGGPSFPGGSKCLSVCHCGNMGVERTPHKSQHTKLTLEKNILPPLLPGFEPVTFQSCVWHSVLTSCPSPHALGAQRKHQRGRSIC